MNVIPREDWQDPAQPVYSTATFSTRDVDTFVLHYTAATDLPDGDADENADDIPSYLRAIQNDYVTNRGYSIGYSFAVDQWGNAYELRGYDFRCAANRGWNHRTIAVLCLVDGADPLTDEALHAVREILTDAITVVGRDLTVAPHSEIGATACPGDGIRSQLPLVTPITDDPDPEVPEMSAPVEFIWKHEADDHQFWVRGANVCHVDRAALDLLRERGVPLIVSSDANVLASYLRHAAAGA